MQTLHTPRHESVTGTPCDRAATSQDCPRQHHYAPTRTHRAQDIAYAMRDAWQDYARTATPWERAQARERSERWTMRAAQDTSTALRIGGAL